MEKIDNISLGDPPLPYLIGKFELWFYLQFFDWFSCQRVENNFAPLLAPDNVSVKFNAK